jgi:hypothetical protein
MVHDDGDEEDLEEEEVKEALDAFEKHTKGGGKADTKTTAKATTKPSKHAAKPKDGAGGGLKAVMAANRGGVNYNTVKVDYGNGINGMSLAVAGPPQMGRRQRLGLLSDCSDAELNKELRKRDWLLAEWQHVAVQRAFTENYQVVSVLGSGSSGMVYRAKHRWSSDTTDGKGRYMAVKMIPLHGHLLDVPSFEPDGKGKEGEKKGGEKKGGEKKEGEKKEGEKKGGEGEDGEGESVGVISSGGGAGEEGGGEGGEGARLEANGRGQFGQKIVEGVTAMNTWESVETELEVMKLINGHRNIINLEDLYVSPK